LENEGILYVFLVFQTEEVGQKDGCGSQTQLRGVAIEYFLHFSPAPRQGAGLSIVYAAFLFDVIRHLIV